MFTIRRLASVVTGFALAGYCLFAASAAYAVPAPPPDWPVAPPTDPGPTVTTVTRTIQVGSPLWMFALVAVAAAALALAAAFVIAHARHMSAPPRQAHA